MSSKETDLPRRGGNANRNMGSFEWNKEDPTETTIDIEDGDDYHDRDYRHNDHDEDVVGLQELQEDEDVLPMPPPASTPSEPDVDLEDRDPVLPPLSPRKEKEEPDHQDTVGPDKNSSEPMGTCECCICFDTLVGEGNVQGCSGSQATHYQCTECEMKYLRTELASGHAFDSRRWMGGDEDSGLVSEPEQLPCPLFMAGDCDCASLPLTGLCSLLSESEEIAKLYHDAFRRVVEAKLRKELPTPPPTTTAAPAGVQTVQDVYRDVRDALDEASLMRCPDCGFPGLKDEACMHISCEGPACSTSWCYCCGRHRKHERHSENCRGCDAGAWHLEAVPGWGAFALPGEHRGIGARNEFHRRRMLYYIQRIKKETPESLWLSFRQEYPRILSGIPTCGRSIDWEELDKPWASTPPLFGNSTEEDLLWKLPPLAETATNTEQDNNTEDVEQREGQQPLHIIFSSLEEVLFSTKGKTWAGALVFTILLLIIRWSVVDSAGFNVVTDILVSAVSYCGLAFVFLRSADYYALHPTNSLNEVQVLGTIVESPYLSQYGRWREFRDTYTRIFLGGITLGSLLVGTSEHLGKIKVTCRVIGSVILTLVLTDVSLLTVLVNISSPPRAQEEPQRTTNFQNWLKLLFSFSLFWSVGLGLLTSESDPAKATGKTLLCLGLSGLVAELAPRLFRGEWPHLWDPLDFVLRLQCHAFCVSLIVGPTLVSIGNSGDAAAARAFGIALCVGIPVSLIWCLVTNSSWNQR